MNKVPSCVLVLLICLGVAPGCARQRAYDRPGVIDADRARDAEECRKANTVPRVSGPLVLSGGRLVRYPFENLDRHGYNLCMEAKGYRITPG
ncbi:MAG: hypothetical protein DMD82_05460 [Candidatus Rokuibacteriota bacterium]|nr:MAG: hypothetical protein DMD82_05460 [Candidatus Rokubacteria bacterium]